MDTQVPSNDVNGTGSETLVIEPPVLKKTKILYIIPFRGKNLYRKKNLKITIQWILTAKEFLKENYDVQLDLLVVEQDREPFDQMPKEKLSHLFLINNGMFNKGWSYNVVVAQQPNYDYYGFCDADILIPQMEALCDQIVEHTVINPKKAFRPFADRLDTSMVDASTLNNYQDVVNKIPEMRSKLTKHGGLSFASNMIFINKETYGKIGGWDEIFRGWGRFDDFITHKLSFICQCNPICSPLEAVHLWHPITLDYSLNQENVHLYDKYIKYSKTDLLKLIESNRKTMGDPNTYKK